MANPISLAWAAVIFLGLPAFAERPPPVARAPTEFYSTPAGAQGPTPGARFLATLPYDARDKLRKNGRVILELHRKKGYVRAAVRLDRPIDEVYAIITQPSSQQRYVPHVAVSKTVRGRTEEGESIDYVVKVLFMTFNFRVQHWFYSEQQRIEWALDPSGENELVEYVGSFQLYALDSKTTIADFTTRVRVKDDFVAFVRSVGVKGEVAKGLTALRNYVATAKVPDEPGRSTGPPAKSTGAAMTPAL